jgi:hypothetical protein
VRTERFQKIIDFTIFNYFHNHHSLRTKMGKLGLGRAKGTAVRKKIAGGWGQDGEKDPGGGGLAGLPVFTIIIIII